MSFDLNKLLDLGALGLALFLALTLSGIVYILVKSKTPVGKSAAESYSSLSACTMELKNLLSEFRSTLTVVSGIGTKIDALVLAIELLRAWHAPNDEGRQEWRRSHSDIILEALEKMENRIKESIAAQRGPRGDRGPRGQDAD
jgi:hypothetical protein